MNNNMRNAEAEEKINFNRSFMKCPEFYSVMQNSDQSKKLTQPPLCKEAKGEIINISADFDKVISQKAYSKLLDIRRSERVFNASEPMSQAELAFLLWSTQGIQEIRGESYAALRPVPSGGARHPFETYAVLRNVQDLKPGIYHYLPQQNVGSKDVSIEFLGELDNIDSRIVEMVAGQKWVAQTSALFLWACVAYRGEWRYGTLSHRVLLIDAGHVGQNAMLSASAMGIGSCCIAAYNQNTCDKLLGLDGYDEFTVYACAFGKPKK